MLAACLAFRNAAPYLREWLLFHAAVGFDRFFLYNNDSTDAYRDVLDALIPAAADAGIAIEVVDWPGYFQQNAIYDDCLRRAACGVDWLAFIDDDEFLFPTGDASLAAILREFEAFAGVGVCWQLYGSSGQLYRENDWVIRRFSRRAAAVDQHVKCLVRPARIVRAIAGGHQFEPQPGFVVVDEHRRPLAGPLTATPSADRLRINHYLIKSVEEFILRRTSRDIGYGDKQKIPLVDWLRLDRTWNAIADTSAVRFAARMEALARDFDAHVRPPLARAK